MTFLLDSNSFIYYLNRQLPAEGKAFIDQLTDSGASYSVMTRLEVLGSRIPPDQRRHAEAMLALFTELPLDDAIVDLAIELRSTIQIGRAHV